MASRPDDAAMARAEAARRKLADCDSRLAKYRAGLEAGADPVVVGAWIAEVRAERQRAERDAIDAPAAAELTRDEVKAMVLALKDMVAVLGAANAKLKAQVYTDLGIELTYHSANRRVIVEAKPDRACSTVRVGGGT